MRHEAVTYRFALAQDFAATHGIQGVMVCLILAAALALGSGAAVAERDWPTAILVSPIHEAQVVRGDDGMDHVEYDLLVVSVFPEPVTLTSVTVLDPSGKKLMRIEGSALTATTQPLFAHTGSAVIPASAAVSIEVDLILPTNAAPEQVTHKIAYTLKAGSELTPMITGLEIDAPEVAINRQPPIVIKPPVKGGSWLAASACCKPNLHRDLRVAIDGVRIDTAETFAVDWAKVKNDKLFDRDGKKAERYTASARTSSQSPMAPWSRFTMACPMRCRLSRWFPSRRRTTAAII